MVLYLRLLSLADLLAKSDEHQIEVFPVLADDADTNAIARLPSSRLHLVFEKKKNPNLLSHRGTQSSRATSVCSGVLVFTHPSLHLRAP